MLLAPAVGTAGDVPARADRLHGLAQPPRRPGSPAAASAGARSSSSGSTNYRRRPDRLGVRWTACSGCSATARSSCRSCSVWRCSSRCCSTRPGSGCERLPHRHLPAVRGARCDRLAAVGLPLPARREPHPGRASTRSGLPAPDFLGPATVFFSVANIGIWGGVGFNMIVLYTALRGIPARAVRRGPRRRRLRSRRSRSRIKVPLITPALVMTGIFSMIATLQVFSEPATLQPMTDSISSTWVPLMTIYRDAFVNNDIYTAAAASVVLAVGHARAVARCAHPAAATRLQERPVSLTADRATTTSRRAKQPAAATPPRARGRILPTADAPARARSTACCRCSGSSSPPPRDPGELFTTFSFWPSFNGGFWYNLTAPDRIPRRHLPGRWALNSLLYAGGGVAAVRRRLGAGRLRPGEVPVPRPRDDLPRHPRRRAGTADHPGRAAVPADLEARAGQLVLVRPAAEHHQPVRHLPVPDLRRGGGGRRHAGGGPDRRRRRVPARLVDRDAADDAGHGDDASCCSSSRSGTTSCCRTS